MREVIENVYTFGELSKVVQARVLERYRGYASEYFDADYIIEDAIRVGELFGIEFAQRKVVHTVGGTDKFEPAIYWQGFGSQGDGARFEGKYAYRRGSLSAVKSYAPADETLHNIARNLATVQRKHGYKLSARVVADSGSHYSHANSVSIYVEYGSTGLGVLTDEQTDEIAIADNLRAFMQWIYRQLNAEYDYRMSDECILEELTDKEFYSDGSVYEN